MLLKLLAVLIVLSTVDGGTSYYHRWWRLKEREADKSPGRADIDLNFCLSPGYIVGGKARLIEKSASPQITMESSMLSTVFGASSGAGYALAGAAGYVSKVAKFAGALNAMGGVFGGLMYATEPTAEDILNAVQDAINQVSKMVESKIDNMQAYVDQEIVELEKTLMERQFKKMFHGWANCLLATSDDLMNECMRETYWSMASSEYSFLTYKDELGTDLLTSCLQGLSSVSATYKNTGRRALLYAVRKKRCECIEVLLKAGAEIDHKDNNGETAIFQAASLGGTDRLSCFETLLMKGANPKIANNNGETVASKLASQNRYYRQHVYYKNVARGQTATAKYGQGQGYDSDRLPRYAVDGFEVQNVHKKSCFVSKAIKSPWWKVQLSKLTKIGKVIITNRDGGSSNENRVSGARVKVWHGDTDKGRCRVEGTGSGAGLGDMTGIKEREMTCIVGGEPLEGDMVQVYIYSPDENKYLTLCEVQVLEHEPSFRKYVYVLKGARVTECPSGYETEKSKCRAAYILNHHDWLIGGEAVTPSDLFHEGEWNDRPYGCSVRKSDGNVYWNDNVTPNSISGDNYRLVCEKGEVTNYDKKFLLSLEVSLPVFREYANLVLMSLSTLVQTYDAGTAEHSLYSERLANSVKKFKEYANTAVDALVEGWGTSTCNIRTLKCRSWSHDDYDKLSCSCRTNRLYLETEKCQFLVDSRQCCYKKDNGHYDVNCHLAWKESDCKDDRLTKQLKLGFCNGKNQNCGNWNWKDEAKAGMETWINDELTVIKTSIRNYWQNELLDLIPTWEESLTTSSKDGVATDEAIANMLRMRGMAEKMADANTKREEAAKMLAPGGTKDNYDEKLAKWVADQIEHTVEKEEK